MTPPFVDAERNTVTMTPSLFPPPPKPPPSSSKRRRRGADRERLRYKPKITKKEEGRKREKVAADKERERGTECSFARSLERGGGGRARQRDEDKEKAAARGEEGGERYTRNHRRRVGSRLGALEEVTRDRRRGRSRAS